MDTFFGLDLGAPRGVWCQMQVDPQTSTCEVRNETSALWDDLPAPATLEDALRLQGEEQVRQIIAPGKEREAIRREFAPYANRLRDLFRSRGEPHGLGVVVPYGSAVPFIRGAEGLWSPPRRAGVGKRFLVLESPFAACVELLVEWRGRPGTPPLPPRWLVLVPSSFGVELLTVDIRVENTELRLETRDWREFPADIKSSGEELLRRLERAAPLPAPAGILTVGERCHEMGERLGNAWGIPADCRVRQAETAPAAGIARLAAAETLRVVYGAEVRQVRCSRVIPRPLGILGCNAQGRLFWRRLFQPGVPFGAEARCALNIGQSKQLRLVRLAEATVFDREVPLWLPQSAWQDFGLRWHSSWNVANVAYEARAREDIRGQVILVAHGPAVWPLAWSEESLKAKRSTTL